MKQTINQCALLFCLLLVGSFAAAQNNTGKKIDNPKTTSMKTYLIEREIPDAGKLTPEQLKAVSQTSCGVLKEMGPRIEWLHSYVTGNKIFCLYKAENEELIKEHAKKGGFPANTITQVSSVISPATAN